jgi:hypothetical protein
MMPHTQDLARRRDDFWRGLTKTVLLILAGAAVLAGLIIWRIYE